MGSVKAVPSGYSTVTTALNLKGAANAIEFYKKAFGAEERERLLGPDGLILHSEIMIGDSIVMISDAMQNAPTQSSMHLYVQDCDAWWKRATEAGLQVVMPIQNMFWGDRFGVLLDSWGNRWSIASHLEDLSPDEMRKRSEEAMKRMK